MINTTNKNEIVFEKNGHRLEILPWGYGLRIHDSFFVKKYNWALTENKNPSSNFQIKYDKQHATIINGKTKATLDKNGKLTFYNLKNQKILEEYWRNRKSHNIFLNDHQYIVKMNATNSSALKIDARDFKSNLLGDYEIHARFEADDDEKFFGMGQYQQQQLNLKGCKLELAQRNSQTTVPFLISSKGYGFLWNNPGIGDVSFANNLTDWHLVDSDNIDYWICADENPQKILADYTDVTGHVPRMPNFALGLWQSKMRYRTQDEVLNVAEKYHKLGIPLSIIVIDYFHWTHLGDFKFDPKYFPNPRKMVEKLNALGIKLMVSVWPNISTNSENYSEMKSKNYLVRSDKGNGITMSFQENSTFWDATNPGARKFVWSKIKNNYWQNNIHLFWLDETEPEYSQYDFDNHRLYLGRNTKVGNIYPKLYAKAFYDGEKNSNQKNRVSLIRSAWAGSQKYGTLVWSGDTDTSFKSMRYQYQVGLNIGLAGIPWWTCDIGGFHGGSANDPVFKELLIRWFEFATFSPILRMHGDRNPHEIGISDHGGGKAASGAPNEIWSFGDNVFRILKKFVLIREKLRPYLAKCFEKAHSNGSPIMRTLFYEFPDDKKCWEVYDEHLLGNKYLVAPIFKLNQRERKVYLPEGYQWVNWENRKIYKGGDTIVVEAPLDSIPVFIRK